MTSSARQTVASKNVGAPSCPTGQPHGPHDNHQVGSSTGSGAATFACSGGKSGLAQVERLAGESGREILAAMMSGELPYPPMNETKNMTLLQVDHGRAVFQAFLFCSTTTHSVRYMVAGSPLCWTRPWAVLRRVHCQLRRSNPFADIEVEVPSRPEGTQEQCVGPLGITISKGV